MEKKIKAYGYARVSTHMQVNGASKEVQFQSIRKTAAEKNLDLQEIFWEPGVSAKTAHRPELIRMLGKLASRSNDVKALIVYDVSRLSRNAGSFYADIAPTLCKAGVQLYSSTQGFDDTPEGKLLMSFNLALAQYDNDKKAVRVSDNMAETAKQGWNITIPPLGFRTKHQYVVDASIDDDPKRKKHSILIPDNECGRAELVKQTLLRFSEGDLSPMQLVEYTKKIGLKTKKGEDLTLNSLLKNATTSSICGF